MQGTFCIYPKRVKTIAGEYPELYNELNKYIGQLEEVRGALKGSYGNVKSVIKSIEQTEKENVKSLKQMETVLRNITGHYTNAEKVISGGTQHTLSAAKDTNQSTYNVPNGTEEVVSKYKETGDKSILLEGLAAIIGGFGVVGSQFSPVLETILGYLQGEEIDTDTIGWLASRFTIGGTVGLFEFGFDYANNGWDDSIRTAFGIPVEGLKHVDDIKPFSDFLGDAVASTGVSDVVFSVMDNGFENYQEYKEKQGTKDEISVDRAIAETVIESGVDIGLGAVATAGAGFVLATVGAPAVLAGAVAGAGVWAINKGLEYFTGKDAGEWIADGICDIGEGIAKWFKK